MPSSEIHDIHYFVGISPTWRAVHSRDDLADTYMSLVKLRFTNQGFQSLLPQTFRLSTFRARFPRRSSALRFRCAVCALRFP
jgi:hypothetical protein